MNCFGNWIQLFRAKTIRGNTICNKKYTTEKAIRLSDKQNIQKKRCCSFFRREVLQADCKTLSNTASVEDNRRCEVNTPQDLVNFFRYLVGGTYVGRELTAGKTYRIKSISEDVVFAATSERRTPAKHSQIGMAIKGLTGSKKLLLCWMAIQHSNNFLLPVDHCINYDGIEEHNWHATALMPTKLQQQ